MAFYKTCPYCGAHLDPGEKCDCQEDDKQLDEVEERFIMQAELIQLKLEKERIAV